MMEVCKKLLLILSSSVLALLIMEIAVRVLDLPPRPLSPLPITDYHLSEDPVIRYEYTHDHTANERPFDDSHRGFSINSNGFRDYEYVQTKPEDTYRIIVLGDSTTAGNGVPDLDNTYTKQLEKLLNTNNSTGIHYEVLNMGVGGYQTMQEIQTLRVKGLKFKPDLVLVTFASDDFNLHSDGGVYKRLIEQTRVSKMDTLIYLYNRFLRWSRLAFILHNRLRPSQNAQDDFYIKNILKGKTTVSAGFALLSELQQRHGFLTLVLILPVFLDPFTEYKSADIHQRVFQSAEGLQGIHVLDLLPSFAHRDNNARKFSYDGSHMNEYGHRTMAEILLPVIKAVRNASTSTNLKMIASKALQKPRANRAAELKR